MQGFVSSNGGRNTISLLQGCIWTVVISSWSSIHPNLPSNEDTERDITRRRAKWVAVGILAPEYLAFLSLREWFEVRWLLKEIIGIMERRGSIHTGMEVTASNLIGADAPLRGALPDEEAISGHAGPKLDQEAIVEERSDEPDRPQLTYPFAESVSKEDIDENSQQVAHDHGKTPISPVDDDEPTSPTPSLQTTVVFAYYVYMGGFEVLLWENRPFRLKALQFLDLLERGHIDLPNISNKTIQSYSKSDLFTKPWACLQSFWFITVLVSRALNHLPLTTLELFTAGQVCCAFTTYISSWKKPKDVEVPTRIPLKGNLEDIPVLEDNNVLYEDRNNSRVCNDETINRQKTGMQAFILLCFLPTLVFATCHLLAWDLYFITPVEKILWRISSVCCLVLPLAAVGLGDITRRGNNQFLNAGITTSGLLYVLFRVYIYVEIFASLRQLPSEVYEDDSWTRYVPHVGV
jgi:hypothetical protein